MVPGQQYQLKDSRDNKDYYISKLLDGNIWMTQNLDLDIVTTENFYTPQNTDIPSNWTATRATYVTGNNMWLGDGYEPESYDPGDICWNGELSIDGSSQIYEMTDDCTSTGANEHYAIGNYYNWSAAIAMNSSSGYNSTSIINQSICPAGWTLPTRSSLNSLLTVAIGDYLTTTAINSPIYMTLTGYLYGNIGTVGYSGVLWSRESYDSGDAYSFYLAYNDYFDPEFKSGRDIGYSVRCMVRQ